MPNVSKTVGNTCMRETAMIGCLLYNLSPTSTDMTTQLCTCKMSWTGSNQIIARCGRRSLVDVNDCCRAAETSIVRAAGIHGDKSAICEGASSMAAAQYEAVSLIQSCCMSVFLVYRY